MELKKCPICFESIQEPRALSCCGTVYCQDCHQTIEQKKVPCPFCRTEERQAIPAESLIEYFLQGQKPDAWPEVKTEVEQELEQLEQTTQPDKCDPGLGSFPKEIRAKDSSAPLLRITIKTLDSKKQTLDLSPDLSYKQLKQALAEALGVDGENLRMIHRGQPMLDDWLLSRNLKQNDLIHLVYQMRGS